MPEEREVVKAQRIEVTDSEGRVVMVLGTDGKNRPQVVMMDTDGGELLQLGIIQNRLGEAYPRLGMCSADRQVSLDVGIVSISTEEGEYQEGGLGVETPEGLFSVYARDDGQAGFLNLNCAEVEGRKGTRKPNTAK